MTKPLPSPTTIATLPIVRLLDDPLPAVFLGLCTQITLTLHHDESITLYTNGRHEHHNIEHFEVARPLNLKEYQHAPMLSLFGSNSLQEPEASISAITMYYAISPLAGNIEQTPFGVLLDRVETLWIDIARDGFWWRINFTTQNGQRPLAALRPMRPSEEDGVRWHIRLRSGEPLNAGEIRERLFELAALVPGLHTRLNDNRGHLSRHECFLFDGVSGIQALMQHLFHDIQSAPPAALSTQVDLSLNHRHIFPAYVSMAVHWPDRLHSGGGRHYRNNMVQTGPLSNASIDRAIVHALKSEMPALRRVSATRLLQVVPEPIVLSALWYPRPANRLSPQHDRRISQHVRLQLTRLLRQSLVASPALCTRLLAMVA